MRSYHASTDADLKAGYLWWAVKCCFGVEYVREVLYENDQERRRCQYTPIFARMPLNTKANADCETLREFERYLQNHPQEGISALYADMRNLYTETAGVLQQEENHYDVFIAWHDKEGSSRCQKFAKELKNWLNEKRVYSFASFSALKGKEIWHFEPYIYAAMATARVFVIVIDDYQALGEKFLKWEIKRMGLRKNQDQKASILFNGMNGHTGQIPAGLMEGWQRHYEDSEVTPDRVSLVGRDVMDALFEKKADVSVSKLVIPSAIAINRNSSQQIKKKVEKEDEEPNPVALTVPGDYIPQRNNLKSKQKRISEDIRHYYEKLFKGFSLYGTSCATLVVCLILCAVFGFIGLPYPVFHFPKLLLAFLIIGALALISENIICVSVDFVLLTLASVTMMRGILETAGTFWTANHLIFGTCSAVLMLCMLYHDSSLCKKKIREALIGYVQSQGAEVSYVLGVDITEYPLKDIFAAKECISYFKHAAENGHMDAMYALAGCYSNGCYVEKDEKQAIDYLYQMMIAGDERGGRLLGEYCRNNAESGVFWKQEKKLLDWAENEVENESPVAREIMDAYYQYVERNAENTGFWKDNAELINVALTKAEKDNADSQFVLGMYYQYARQELDTAMDFYCRAAQQGHQKARTAVAKIYYQAAEACRTGLNTRIDLEQAVAYYREAISWGYRKKGAEGLFSVGRMYLDGTEETIRNVDKAHLCFMQAWNEGDYKGFSSEWYKLGLCYYGGDGTSMDMEKAVRCFDIAADNGSEEAQFLLGKCYLEGLGVPIDRKQAVKRFKRADRNRDAVYYLGICYEKGWGVPASLKSAMKSYTSAADMGHSLAAYAVSKFYFMGIFLSYDRKTRGWDNEHLGEVKVTDKAVVNDKVVVAEDPDEGLKYLSQAARAGVPEAQAELGQLYAEGKYAVSDIQTAKKWFSLAAEQGNAEAQRWLESIEKQS